MPIATVDIFTRPEHVADYWIDRLELDKETIGLNGVIGYEQKLVPASSYPVVAVNPGRFQKEVHASRTWLYTWRINFYIMHAKFSVGHLDRSREQNQFVTDLVKYLESDKTLGDKVIFSFVTDENMGILRPYAEKSDMVLSTRIDWFATSEGRF